MSSDWTPPDQGAGDSVAAPTPLAPYARAEREKQILLAASGSGGQDSQEAKDLPEVVLEKETMRRRKLESHFEVEGRAGMMNIKMKKQHKHKKNKRHENTRNPGKGGEDEIRGIT